MNNSITHSESGSIEDEELEESCKIDLSNHKSRRRCKKCNGIYWLIKWRMKRICMTDKFTNVTVG